MIRLPTVLTAAALAVFPALTATAAEDTPVGITGDLSHVTVETPDGPVEIRRNQDPEAEISGKAYPFASGAINIS
ncbi:hypothetical protein [Roseospira navarrensis]|uniref:Uncharacterized protein n=1 Tax=Roseospira navarrensis TaxID=140058 RepID=A0A7X2D646_9PROT|nr:hypothetical protein [Roseospira navarrensis]MQX38332.1 hypothetical protein [Roseospira navarrensis]